MRKRLLYTLFYLALCISPGNGFFEEIGISPRATAMGNSFVAISDDLYSIYYNPAGLGQLTTRNISFVYVQLYPALGGEGINDIFLGANLIHKKLGIIGVAWQNRTLTDIVTADTFYIATARYLEKQKLFVGISLKLLRLEYIYEHILTNPYFRIHGTGKSAIGLDIGFLKYVKKKFKVGLSIKNINQPDMGLGVRDILPATIRAGICYMTYKTLLAVGVENTYNMIQFNTGIERTLMERIKLRSGVMYSLREKAQSIIFSIGIGLAIKRFHADYSYTLDIVGGPKGSGGIHRFGLTVKF